MKKPFIEIKSGSFRMLSFDTQPIEGYEQPKNFPNCCEWHKNTYKEAEDFFRRFPNCCDEHKKLSKNRWFNKQDYKGLPEKITNQLSFTEHHIEKRINITGWYHTHRYRHYKKEINI